MNASLHTKDTDYQDINVVLDETCHLNLHCNTFRRDSSFPVTHKVSKLTFLYRLNLNISWIERSFTSILI